MEKKKYNQKCDLLIYYDFINLKSLQHTHRTILCNDLKKKKNYKQVYKRSAVHSKARTLKKL